MIKVFPVVCSSWICSWLLWRSPNNEFAVLRMDSSGFLGFTLSHIGCGGCWSSIHHQYNTIALPMGLNNMKYLTCWFHFLLFQSSLLSFKSCVSFIYWTRASIKCAGYGYTLCYNRENQKWDSAKIVHSITSVSCNCGFKWVVLDHD